ncbi:group 1 glycosyl transferase [Rouxiella silvae]|uniref:Group 1 glycosyl transferase n=1 Tax=Rouxiella silvae TaxID=1646373 RepID=A0AA40X3I6_9GAMM|nr:group 1 glycosyl transferase [Rouxiella silvae]MBF6638032.1 group 1 glycosyl transferase [Rouxiella silvae]ORJ20122.1 group 1 glycosyl transferase [Rouxiella silvae]
MKTLIQPLRSRAFKTQNLNESLQAAEMYGSLLHTVDIGQYDDPALEQALIDAAEAALPSLAPVADKRDCLHIISEAYIIGGHTRLMEKLAGMHTEKPDLLITRSADEKALARCNSVFSTVYEIKSVELLEKIAEIRAHCALYKRVVLHIHSNDITTVVACGLVKKIQPLRVYFVNHADHAFTFGSAIADYYFQLSSYGARLDSLKTLAGETSFLGIPVTDVRPATSASVDLSSPELLVDSKLNFFSSGSAIKFKPFQGADIRPLVRRILDTWPKATFTLVGITPLTNFWWWPLKIRYGSRLKILRFLPYDKFIGLSREADFYVDSYPFPGGTAFAEQILGGKRGIGLVSKVQGYSPADKLKTDSVDQVIDKIKNYSDEGVVEEIISVNGYEAVKARYLACLYEDTASTFNMESLVPWSGDSQSLRVRKQIFVPVSPAVMKYLFKTDKQLFINLFLRMSLFNKAYISWNAIKG